MCVYVCVCVRACVRACVRVCVCVCVCVCVLRSLSLSLSLSLSHTHTHTHTHRVACPWTPLSSCICKLSGMFKFTTEISLYSTHTVNRPVALDSALQSLSVQCQLSPCDLLGKGKFTTVVIRFNADIAMSVERPPARAVSYRRKSPSELKRDQQRAIARQQHTRRHG